MALIFSPSVPSTGTNFIRHFFSLHQKVHMRRLDMILRGEVNIDNLNSDILVFTHFMYHLDRMQDIWDFQSCHTVVPMRDPLASMITFSGYTSQEQQQALRIERKMEEYYRALELQEYRPVIYVPVDLYSERTFEERKKLLVEASNDLVSEADCIKWAEEWPVHNTRGDYGPKRWYQAGDIEKVKAHLEVDGRWKQLKQNENKVRPYLEQLGYKELMWYD